jgi:Mce-associated membrane protein
MTGLEMTEAATTAIEPELDGLCHDPSTTAAAAFTPTHDREVEAPTTQSMAADTAAADAHVDAGTDGASRRSMRASAKRRVDWSGVLARGVLPGVALVLAIAAGYLKWVDGSAHQADLARIASVQAASESTVALLSYKHDTVDDDVAAARQRLTGDFKDAYNSLTHDVVIPGAKQKQISTIATVPAAASVSATENQAVVLVLVDQTITMGNDAPTNSASSVKVTLDRIDGRWLISQFDPV